MNTRSFLIRRVAQAPWVGWLLWAVLLPVGADGRAADRPPNILFLLSFWAWFKLG